MRVMLIAAMLAGGAVLAFAPAAEAGEVLVAPRNAAPVCAAYAKAINTRRVAPPDTPLACDRGLWNDPEFSPGAKRVAVPPAMAQLLLLDARWIRLASSREDYENRRGEIAQSADADPSRAFTRYPLSLVARFEPWIDIDNDGIADDVALVGNSGMPCGFNTQYQQELAATWLVVLDRDHRLDSSRTFALLQPQLWAMSATKQQPTRHRTTVIRWQDMFSVFRYQGTTYIDRRGLRRPDGRNPTVVYGVFKATPDKVEQVCELEAREGRGP